MLLRAPLASFAAFVSLLQLLSALGVAQDVSPVCKPTVTSAVIVASPEQRVAAGAKAQPPITDTANGFAWPDTPLGIIKTSSGYEFFASDGGNHSRQMWQGHWVGNNKYGSFVTTAGTLDNPLGSGDPKDVSVSSNRNLAVNPIYPSYGYMGGGPVYQVPAGMPGAGNLLATYHGELPVDALYATLGLAASADNGLTWTDLGEIIRLNQAYELGLDGFEIGDGPLVLSPDGKYFYLYFPDWIANGTLHITNLQGVNTTTNVSVARALVSDVLEAAFGSKPRHSIAFQKFYDGSWILQPAIGGASTDLSANSSFQGYLDIHFSSFLHRYVMIISNDTTFGYAESVDGLNWSLPVLLGTFGPIAAYPTAVGLGDDPHTLGQSYYVYFTHLPTSGVGWKGGELRRLTLTCQ
ncbi:MAG TPA: hypothetical protein VN310_06280 [Candidatus Dormibacteraeota bacterium]|jgi:hypothetical protein|nr:hypothetical protein [Candidatus Dormibacteraeota bacterium]